MNKIKQFITAKWCAMISALLGMLGFAACGDNNETYGPDLYGQPYAKFKVEGAVLNEECTSVKSVKVYVKEHYGDTATTAQDGKFIFNAEDIVSASFFWVMAEDQSGIYEKDSAKIDAKYEGGDNDMWNSGSYSTTHNFTLKKKESEPAKN